jgi:hypothetical protein
MPGILSQCSNMLFPMECDIYYARESQDKYGRIEKYWEYGQTQKCSFFTLSDSSNNLNFTFDTAKFYRLESMLFGRAKDDFRKDKSGLYYPLSHILVTNIKSIGCDEQILFFDSHDSFEQKPTVFEIKMFQPFIGVFSSVEYYKIQLERSDIQELNQGD